MANRLIKGYFYSEGTLNRTCTDGCAQFLRQYEDSVASNCGDEAWENYFNADETAEDPQSVPVRIIPSFISYLFSLTCLKNEGRFCNAVIGTAAMLADPGNTLFGWAPIVSNDTEADIPSNCDLCFIERLRMEAGSPYYEGPRLSSLGLYESLTSSCGVSGMPLTTSTLGFSTPTGPATGTPTPPCAGNTYSIQSGDTCYSISKSQSIGTGWLLDDNDLFAWCADFPTTGDICITNACRVYTVRGNDTCTSIARSANITVPQLKAWNPIINLGCYNLYKMNGTTLCVSAPGRPYIPPTNVTITGSPDPGVTAVPVPTDIANGTATSCAKYHYVAPGEYCNLLSLKYGISLEDLVTLNPSINENCTNLYAQESYCVQAVGDLNTYPGRPGFTSSQPTTTTTTTTPAGPSTASTLLPDSTMAPYERNDTRSPLAEHTREDCATYFEGAWFANVSLPAGGSLASACALAAETYFAGLDSLGLWNPSLGNASTPGCAFASGRRYCGQLYWDANGAEPAPEGPLYEFEIRGYLTRVDYAYCTSTDPIPGDEGEQSSSTVSTTMQSVSTTMSAPTPTATAPGQTQSGQATNCNEWVIAQSGDSCWAIADRTKIALEDLYAWNTALGKDGSECGTMIWPDYWYCVGISA